MKRILLSFILVFMFSLPAYALDYADQQDTLRMLDRLERLEHDLTLLQRQVYGGENTSQPSSPVTSGGGDTNIARIEARIAEIEEQMRTLTGKVEQVEFANSKLSEKLDKMAADHEYRFNALENNMGGRAAPQAEQEQSAQNPAPAVDEQENTGQEEGQPATGNEDNKQHVLGTLPTKGKKKPVVEEAPAVAAEEEEPNKAPTPEEQYKKAFGLVRAADYEAAIKALTQFIAENKKHPLTGGAYYWLGESYYAQKTYDKAAIQFLQSYKNFPKGKKAPESLLKLSMSLGKLKKKKEACSTLAKLEEDFPDTSNALKERAKEESARLGCS